MPFNCVPNNDISQTRNSSSSCMAFSSVIIFTMQPSISFPHILILEPWNKNLILQSKPQIKEIQTAITTTNKQTIKQNRTLPSPFLALCLNSLLLDFCTVYQKTKHNFCCLRSTRLFNMAVKVRVKVTSPVPESLSSVHSISLSHCLS